MRRDEAGLTLLELTLVVFILSVVALGAVSLLDTTDGQIRFDDTQARLQAIRRAILGEPDAAFDGQCLLGGFVADNGALPEDVESLARKPAALPAYGTVQPQYGATTLAGAAVALGRGWRGPYLALPPSRGTPRFRDGWGRVSAVDDALHHGWNDLDPTAEPFVVMSYGSDGALDDGDETGYELDVALEIAADDWQVDLGGWAVDVRNATGGSLGLRVAVVYTASGAWKSHDTAGAAVASGATQAFTFAADTRVPLGRHLVLLVDDGTGVPYGHAGGTYAARRAAFFARTQPARFTLEAK